MKEGNGISLMQCSLATHFITASFCYAMNIKYKN